MTLLTSIGLCLAGLAAIIVEFFVPAAGIIGVLGFASIVGGVVLAFVNFGTVVGASLLIAMVIVTPVVMALYFKLFPKSFVGRWLILRGGQKQEEGFASFTPERYVELAGKQGEALTILRPAGMASIDGRKYSVVTGGEFISQGEAVTVIRVEGSKIVVRKGA